MQFYQMYDWVSKIEIILKQIYEYAYMEKFHEWNKSSEADADVWMKRDFNPNGDLYYKYMICYVDDLIYIGFKPKKYMDALNMIYRLNEGFGPPDRYLGSNVEKVQMKDVQVLWSTN